MNVGVAQYSASLAYDDKIKRGIPGQYAKVLDGITGVPVDNVLALDGTPLKGLMSNSQGYVPPFQVVDGPPLILLRIGHVDYHLLDLVRVGKSAEAAVEAALAAEAAANLVGAPADDVVALMLSDSGTASSQTARGIIRSETAGTRVAVEDAADPLAFLDQVKMICNFPVRENGETSWPQGFSINESANEIYVANQNGTELRIDVRSLDTGARSGSKIFTTENGAFSESLDWFYSGGGDLCFIVWPKAGGGSPSAYSIVNYTKGTIGPQIPILGFFRGSRDGSNFITSDAWSTSIRKMYVYDWESVKAGSPVLSHVVPVDTAGPTAAKNQGLASIAGHMFLNQGSQSENPTLTMYRPDGQLGGSRTYSRSAFKDTINKLLPGALSNSDYLYEAEGATSVGGKLVTGHVINDNPAVAADGVMVILQHNSVDGVRIAASRTALKVIGEWRTVPLAAGWSHIAGKGLEVRTVGGAVEFRGFANNSTFTGGYVAAGALPEGIPAPEREVVFPVTGNTAAIRSVKVTPAGAIEFYTSAATAAWYEMHSVRYRP